MLDIAAKLNESNEQRTDLLFGLIHVGPKLLRQFISSTREDLSLLQVLCDEALKKHDYASLVEPAFRIIHTVKGNAALFDLTVYKNYAMALEDELAEGPSVDSVEWVYNIRDQIEKVEDVLYQTEKYLEEMILIQDPEEQEITSTQAINGNMFLLIDQLNRKFDKQATLRSESFDLSCIPENHQETLAEIVTQLVSNAVAHGIEKTKVRRDNGKFPVGVVYIETKIIDESVRIRVQDDGAGPNLKKLKALAEKNLNYDAKQLGKMLSTELAQLIFLPGLSTAEIESDIAGRGVGMDMIKKLVKDMGADLQFRFALGQGCQFDISLPLS